MAKQKVKQKTEPTIRCIGEICYDEGTNKLRIELGKTECPPEQLDMIREQLVKEDVDVEWVIPTKAKKVKVEGED